MPTLTLIALCFIAPFFLFATCWPAFAWIMRGIRQARRDRVCKQPTVIRRTWFILILPMVLCHGQTAHAEGVAPTLWEMPQHVAQLATEAQPEDLWVAIGSIISLSILAVIAICKVACIFEWEEGYRKGCEDTEGNAFNQGFGKRKA